MNKQSVAFTVATVTVVLAAMIGIVPMESQALIQPTSGGFGGCSPNGQWH